MVSGGRVGVPPPNSRGDISCRKEKVGHLSRRLELLVGERFPLGRAV